MELDAILDGIQTAGQQQIDQIHREAERKTSQIKSKIQKDADVQKKRILDDGKAHLHREQAMIEQQAVIQALQIHADARQSLIERVIKKAAEGFSNLRNSKDYKVILGNLIGEALDCIKPSLINDQKIVLHFDPRDKALIKSLLKNITQEVDVQYDIECSGGCNAETEDGMVLALNTIESRFEHAEPYIKQNLSIFFERKFSSG